MMDRGPALNGRKVILTVIIGLILFTVVSMFITLGIGRLWGNVKNKQALEHERKLDTQMMRDRESGKK